MNIIDLSASQVVENIKLKKLKATEVFDAFEKQSQKLNPKLNALIAINNVGRKKAEEVDRQIQSGKDPGPLAGVPIVLKDMFCTKGLATTAGSKALENYLPPYSATVTKRLESAGAIILAKSNQDEFAMGSSNENSAFGVCRNPWDQERVPGGSSGGSAVAVSARMSPLSFGTDTGGSIRQPASFCGIVGVKPTYGRISRYGIVAFASSLDQAGPMSRSVLDAALALEVTSGFCEKDSTSSRQAVPTWSKNLNKNLKGIKVGMPKPYFGEGIGAETLQKILEAKKIFESAGAKVIEVDLAHVEHAVSVYYLIATSEASSNLARYDGVRYGFRADFTSVGAQNLEDFYSRTRGLAFGSEVKRRIVLGTHALSSGYYDAYYKKACQVRRLILESFLQAFRACDVLLSPVTANPAFRIGEKIKNPLEMYLNDIYTISTNLAGLPGMSVPAGFDKSGLPIGAQLIAKPFDEQSMLNAAYCLETELKLSEVPNVLR